MICWRRDNRGLASGRGLAVMGGSGCSARERVWHPPHPPTSSHFPGAGAPLTTGHQPAGQVHRSLTIHFLPPLPRAVGSRGGGGEGEGARGRAGAGRAAQATSSRAGPLAGSGQHAVSTPSSNLNRPLLGLAPLTMAAVECRKFAPNIFNKSKCSACFRLKEDHSASAIELNKASRKISKCVNIPACLH